MTKRQAEETAGVIARRAVTYGQLEAAAGITDREAFWRGKDEPQARAELRRLILARVVRGEVAPTTPPSAAGVAADSAD